MVSQFCSGSISQVSLMAQLVKNLSSMWNTWLWSLGWEDPIHGVANSWTWLSYFHYFSDIKNPPANAEDTRHTGSIPESEWSPGEAHGNPLRYSCLENSMDRRAWWATVHEVAMSQTWLSTHTYIMNIPNVGSKYFFRTSWERNTKLNMYFLFSY